MPRTSALPALLARKVVHGDCPIAEGRRSALGDGGHRLRSITRDGHRIPLGERVYAAVHSSARHGLPAPAVSARAVAPIAATGLEVSGARAGQMVAARNTRVL